MTRSLFLFFVCLCSCHSTKIAFDKDLDDNCSSRLVDCPSDSTLWFSCPISCAKSLEPELAIDFSTIDAEDFLQLTARDWFTSSRNVDFENFDGYVTLVMTVPPVLVAYYYEMLEHLQSVYPFVLEIVMIPLLPDKKQPPVDITQHAQGKVIVIQQPPENQLVLDYFTKKLFKVVNDTYATGFLFSVNDDFLQVHHSASFPTLKEHVTKDMMELESHRGQEF